MQNNMSNNKQTSVELVAILRLLSNISIRRNGLEDDEWFEQAKAMDKQSIKHAFIAGETMV
jgi:hypothetical protein